MTTLAPHVTHTEIDRRGNVEIVQYTPTDDARHSADLHATLVCQADPYGIDVWVNHDVRRSHPADGNRMIADFERALRADGRSHGYSAGDLHVRPIAWQE